MLRLSDGRRGEGQGEEKKNIGRERRKDSEKDNDRTCCIIRKM